MTTMTKSQTEQGTEQSIAPVMRAAVIMGFGGPAVLEPTEVPVAEPQPGHLLIKVNAAGLNRFDHSIRQGEIAPELPWPHILGADAAGSGRVHGKRSDRAIAGARGNTTHGLGDRSPVRKDRRRREVG